MFTAAAKHCIRSRADPRYSCSDCVARGGEQRADWVSSVEGGKKRERCGLTLVSSKLFHYKYIQRHNCLRTS